MRSFTLGDDKVGFNLRPLPKKPCTFSPFFFVTVASSYNDGSLKDAVFQFYHFFVNGMIRIIRPTKYPISLAFVTKLGCINPCSQFGRPIHAFSIPASFISFNISVPSHAHQLKVLLPQVQKRYSFLITYEKG